jgi:hypothetical protein
MTQVAANYPAPEQTALSDEAWNTRLEKIANDARMHESNITISRSSVNKVGLPMLVVGAAMLLVAGVGAFSINLRHALAGIEVGVFTVLAVSLGSLFWIMVFHALNAGWAITVRRQLENVASLVWIPWLVLLVIALCEVIGGGILLEWLDPEVREASYLLKKKMAYLNGPFFLARVLVYGVVWIALTQALRRWSVRGDETGDRTLGRKARFWASFGIPCFALSVAFCAFDFLMSLDFRFFSTMWGVYYFASCALASMGALVLIVSLLRAGGKLQGLVTQEHYHDMGKLMFAFTVFWAYISFSQYFLIWYSNIPEETMWYTARNEGGWGWLFMTLAFGHFVVPFLILIFRGIKRNPKALALMGVFMIVVTMLDMAFVILPMVNAGEGTTTGAAGMLIHVAGALGVVLVFGWFVCGKVSGARLLPTKDPLLHESMKHKNYV